MARISWILIFGTEAELRSCTIATTVVVKHERLLEVNKLYENTEEMYSTFLQTSLKSMYIVQSSWY